MEYIKTFSKAGASSSEIAFISSPRIQANNFKYSSYKFNGEYELTSKILNDSPVYINNNKSNDEFNLENSIKSFLKQHYYGFRKDKNESTYFLNVYPDFIQPYRSNGIFSNQSNFLDFNFPKSITPSNSTVLGFLFYDYFSENSYIDLNFKLSNLDFDFSFETYFPISNISDAIFNFGFLLQQSQNFYKIPLGYLTPSQNLIKTNISKSFNSLNFNELLITDKNAVLNTSGNNLFQIGFYIDHWGAACNVNFSNFSLQFKNQEESENILSFSDQNYATLSNNLNINNASEYIYSKDKKDSSDNFIFNSKLNNSSNYSSNFSLQNGYTSIFGESINLEKTFLENSDGDELFNDTDPDPYNKPNNYQYLTLDDFSFLGFNNINLKFEFNFEGKIFIFDGTDEDFINSLGIQSILEVLFYVAENFNQTRKSTGIYIECNSDNPIFSVWRPKGGPQVYFSCKVHFTNNSVTVRSKENS